MERKKEIRWRNNGKNTLIIYRKTQISLYYSSPSGKSASVLTVGEGNVPEDVLKGERELESASGEYLQRVSFG